jgi:VWFA-related protein
MKKAVLALAAVFVLEAATGLEPTFSLDVPDFLVTGPVKLKARTTDPRVASVDWKVQGKSKVTSAPFELTIDAGRMPLPKSVVATALDDAGHPLFRQEAILNPGERFVSVNILSPLQGQEVSGSVPVLVKPRVPPGEAVASLTLEDGSGPKPLPDARNVRQLEIAVPRRTVALTAFLRTSEGRTAEQTILLNGLGFSSSDSAHIVEQVVSVQRGQEPVEGLTPADFSVKDESGTCDVREVRLLRETPLALGLAIDTSVSLLHTEALKRVTAGFFLSKALKERDLAYLMSFGPAVRRNVAWTRSHDAIRNALLALRDDEEAGTRLHEVLLHALYQFQGAQGGRALILVTDGNVFEDPVSEETALEYVKLSAVPIYALGLPWATMTKRTLREFDDDGKKVKRIVREPEMHDPNLPFLKKLAKASGGRVFEVTKAEDLPAIYREIDHDIRTQYLVSYVARASRKTAFHPVSVKVKGTDVRTAPGYYH